MNRHILMLCSVLVVGCDGNIPVPDAPPTGPHDQVTFCSTAWSATAVAPLLCERACAEVPREGTCTGHSCYSGRGCLVARSPSAQPTACASTFTTDGGAVGCCVARMTSIAAYPMIPTFFECDGQ